MSTSVPALTERQNLILKHFLACHSGFEESPEDIVDLRIKLLSDGIAPTEELVHALREKYRRHPHDVHYLCQIAETLLEGAPLGEMMRLPDIDDSGRQDGVSEVNEVIIALLTKCVEESAARPDALPYFYLGQLTRGRQSLAFFKMALKLSSTISRRQQADIHTAIAQLYMTDLCDEDDAETEVLNSLKAAGETCKDHFPSKVQKAAYLRIIKDYPKAIDQCKSALEQLRDFRRRFAGESVPNEELSDSESEHGFEPSDAESQHAPKPSDAESQHAAEPSDAESQRAHSEDSESIAELDPMAESPASTNVSDQEQMKAIMPELDLEDFNFDSQLELARIMLDIGMSEEAIEVLRFLLEQNDQDVSTANSAFPNFSLQDRVHFHLALALCNIRNVTAAIEAVETAIALLGDGDPDLVDTYTGLRDTLLRQSTAIPPPEPLVSAN